MGKNAISISSALLVLGVMVLATLPIRVNGEHLQIVSLDFEIDNGGLTVGGDGGPWEWGRPGSGTSQDPGPGEAGSGDKAWGCPLNGTYSSSTDAYLELPPVDVSSQLSLELSFLYWSDLSVQEDELNRTGEILGSDSCFLEISTNDDDWWVIRTYNGSSGSVWLEETLDLTPYTGGDLHVRFRLEDDPDGLEDNGFFVDLVIISGESSPEVDIELGDEAAIPTVVSVGEGVRVTIPVEDRGATIPLNTYVTVYIETVEQTPEFFYRYVISKINPGPGYVEWYPTVKGSFRGWINLTVSGEYHDGRSFNIRSLQSIYYDDSSSGLSHYDQDTSVGETTWTTMLPSEDGFSMSSEEVIWSGSIDGGPNATSGFMGPVSTYLETDWIDLKYYTDSSLYIYHKYDFLGPMGSSGGIVEAYRGEGGWTILEPVNLAYRTLRPSVPGPNGGAEAIVGSDDWSVQSFKLAPFIGGNTRIRFTVSSDEDGFGGGWFIDDIMVAGEGYDPYDTEPPEAVEGLDVEVVDNGAVTISYYTSNALDFNSYRIYLEKFEFTAIGGLVPYAELDTADQDSVVVTDLDQEVRYWVAVTAVDVVGNEMDEVVAVSFVPSLNVQNRPPVADIKILDGSYSRSIGEEITFDGSLSRDPDGDPLTYIWTMPDGRTFRGPSAKWSASKAGEDQKVALTVKDSWGLEGTETIEIDILEDDGSLYERGELTPFLLLVLPIVLIIALIVFLASIFGKNSRRKLEKRLQRVGIDLGTFETAQVKGERKGNEMPKKASRSPKVHDLVPMKNSSEKTGARTEELMSVANKEPHEWREHRVARDLEPEGMEMEDEKVHYKPPPLIKVVIECPFCNEIFKERVDPNIINEGEVFTVKCPHCNRSGDITP